ncbi:MAG: GIY-YIG nuclease family protein [Blastochloris viridis]|uniref:GIY-YIG nuclease family protein n=1 Tax=Blastochloris viridis TaxID=1079 RepID=A0A6N4R7I5_BLAVI|nr:MAG: GIY-YIG nuclease family protein [Blastochloris viridis]
MYKRGLALQLLYVDGSSQGLVSLTTMNWTGHLLKFPRTQLIEALARSESSYTGIYILTGESDSGDLAYIGEAENLKHRMRTHDQQKPWWNQAVFVTSDANKLNKAHAKYLEARLVEEALEAKRLPLENTTRPKRPSLSEADIVTLEDFLETLLIVLPALGVDVFVKNTRSNLTDEIKSRISQEFEIHHIQQGIKAQAIWQSGELIVKKGSLARPEWIGAGSQDSSYGKLHQELLRSGILQVQGDLAVFTDNYAFKSPSAASAVVMGRPSNGTMDWKVKGSKQTYKDWEQSQLKK